MARETLTVLSLNAWGGRALYSLMRTLRNRKTEVDIFCFQEVFDADPAETEARHPDEYCRGDLFSILRRELSEFEGDFARHPDQPSRMSLAMFTRRDLPRHGAVHFPVYQPARPVEHGSEVLSARRMQYVRTEVGGRAITVANYHGLWVPGPKTDTPERLVQSSNVRLALESTEGEHLLCGDFNLLPDTESVRILAEGMHNPVVERGVTSTRTPLYRHYQNPDEPNFADYVFASKGLEIRRFEVLPDVASDHAALLITVA